MKQTLLVADGDANCRDLYRHFLSEQGYEVATSSDGVDCLEQLRRLPVGVLVLDLNLRWGGGDGVLGWLREETPTHGIPVILTATPAFPHESDIIIKPPVVDFLTKPFALSVLLERIGAAIEKTAHYEPSALRRLPECSELFIG